MINTHKQQMVGFLKQILEFSALILAIVNGLMLLKYYLNDRPKLVINAIHPDTYQWWFKLPEGVFEGKPTRRYGFLAYIGIMNKGLRKVSIKSWRLYIKTVGCEKVELMPRNIPEPNTLLCESNKGWEDKWGINR